MDFYWVGEKKMFRFLPTFRCGSCVTTLPFQTTIGTVERNINGMLQYQSHSRSSEARDFALLIDNNSYVQNWSLIQISVILLTCSIQVGKSMCSYATHIFAGHNTVLQLFKQKTRFLELCHLIFHTFIFQVYFVRKLFDINTGGYGRARI